MEKKEKKKSRKIKRNYLKKWRGRKQKHNRKGIG